jgi:hypothetical protein
MGIYDPPAAQQARIGTAEIVWLRGNPVFYRSGSGGIACMYDAVEAQAVLLLQRMGRRRRNQPESGGEDSLQLRWKRSRSWS